MADVVKGLTHLAVNQAFVSSSLINRPKHAIHGTRKPGSFLLFISQVLVYKYERRQNHRDAHQRI